MSLSVIICTAPRREEHLANCLALLEQQSFKNFDLVIVDDGSQNGEKATWAFESRLNIQYSWRPNDCCVSLSRNLGAELAQSDRFIFIDADILLNPRALFYYFELLRTHPDSICYGYYGNLKDYVSHSYLVADKWVNWLDERFIFKGYNRIHTYKHLVQIPQEYAWSGNFALQRHIFEGLNGFDTSFMGWGHEDVDFANRAVTQNIQLYFSVDVWAEHQYHESNDRFHQLTKTNDVNLKRRLRKTYTQPQTTSIICQHEMETLGQLIQNHYQAFNKDLEHEKL